MRKNAPVIEIHNSRVIDAEKRRRKPSDSKEHPEKQPKTLFTNLTSRLLSRRNKHKHRKEAKEIDLASSYHTRPETIPEKVVLYESDNSAGEGVMSLISYLNEKLQKQDRNDTEKTGSSIVNDIWKKAVDEFKSTLTALHVQGHKDLLMSELVRNFEEGFDR